MSDEPKLEKTTLADLARALDPILYPHLNPLTQGWPRLMQITTQVCVVFRAAGWVGPEEAKAREAAARREALLEAAEELVPEDLRRHGANCDTEMERLRAKVARVEALASRYYRRREWAVATEIRIALAEPERDKESGR